MYSFLLLAFTAAEVPMDTEFVAKSVAKARSGGLAGALFGNRSVAIQRGGGSAAASAGGGAAAASAGGGAAAASASRNNAVLLGARGHNNVNFSRNFSGHNYSYGNRFAFSGYGGYDYNSFSYIRTAAIAYPYQPTVAIQVEAPYCPPTYSYTYAAPVRYAAYGCAAPVVPVVPTPIPVEAGVSRAEFQNLSVRVEGHGQAIEGFGRTQESHGRILAEIHRMMKAPAPPKE